MPTPISLEQVGAMLGPPGMPWSLNRVERLIRDGMIPCYGRGVARVTFAEAVQAFQQGVLERRIIWLGG